MFNIITKKNAKFHIGDHCVANIDIKSYGRTIKKGSECIIIDRHLFCDVYDIKKADNEKEWILFVNEDELDHKFTDGN